MTKNIGDKVSRVLESKKKSFSSVIFQQKRPPLDSEFNLLQDIQSDNISDLIRNSTPSGFLDFLPIEGSPNDRLLLTHAWKNAIRFKNPIAVVNGWIMHIGGGTNQFQPNATSSIWSQLCSGDEEQVAFILNDPPMTESREDLVFLEVWQSVVKTTDTVKTNGFTQSALDVLENDLIDNNLGIETTQRVQIQYAIRKAEGVDFGSYREGLGFSAIKAQGPLNSASTDSKYIYRKSEKDLGLYISGDGSTTSQSDLKTVDGYVYALPICRIHRKNKTAYSLTNLNGSAYSLTSTNASDRPDGFFHDEINQGDIEDLRHLISLDGFDLDSILEKNLYDLWSRKIPGELKTSNLNTSIRGNKLIQVDAISSTEINGANIANMTPDGKRRSFTDGKDYQKVSISLTNPDVSTGRIWFSPFGKKENSYEYELWDENVFYTRKEDSTYRPRVFAYDANLATRTEITGGTWKQLGEYRTFDYINDNVCKNKLEYIPSSVADVLNKTIVIMIDFVTREGGGIEKDYGGFNYNIEEILEATNYSDLKSIEWNHFNSSSPVTKKLKNTRVTGNIPDAARNISISTFEKYSTDSSKDFRFRGSCVEIDYFVESTGTTTISIPSVLYGRKVYGIYSVFNVNKDKIQTVNIVKNVSSYDVSGIISDTSDIIKFTVLCGDYAVDYVPHTRGVNNFTKLYEFPAEVDSTTGEGVLNVKSVFTQCDAVIAAAGYQDETSSKFIAYANNRMIALSSLEGLGTPVIKFKVANVSEVSSVNTVKIHMLGYYNPATSDQMCFTYTYIPYRGISKTRISSTSSRSAKFRVLKVDNSLSVTSAGTGNKNQYVSEDLKGMTSTLPINANTLDYNFFGANLDSPLSGGNSSLRRVPGRGGAKNEYSEISEYLHEGQVITLGYNTNTESNILRGASVLSPAIHEMGYSPQAPQIRSEYGDLLTDPDTNLPYDIIYNKDVTSYNHLTQWSAIVEGLDVFKGELFLLVITTTSTIYNAIEGYEHKYLELKNLYGQKALGKGNETILNTGVSQSNVNQNLGRKIIGAADIIPLKGRPLINTKLS